MFILFFRENCINCTKIRELYATLVPFFLQTFVFPRKSDEKDAKTFVRYVEEEGPAYMAGLREGKHPFHSHFHS